MMLHTYIMYIRFVVYKINWYFKCLIVPLVLVVLLADSCGQKQHNTTSTGSSITIKIRVVGTLIVTMPCYSS